MSGEVQASRDDLRATYGAIVDYHNGLVQTRFTVAGLFLAANGFLAAGFFQSDVATVPWYVLPALGILLAAICWLLEVRTYHLLMSLGSRGLCLESELGISHSHGFFSLMERQQTRPRLLVTRLRLPLNKFVRYVVSHSFGIGVLYGSVAVFWMAIIVLHVAGQA